MLRFACIAVLSVVLAALTGCAAMRNGSTQEVRFSSQPRGAKLFVNDKAYGTTPTTLKLWRAKNHDVVFSKSGFADEEIEINSIWSGDAIAWSFVGALAWWGPLEWLIDLPMGSLKEFDRTQVRVRLEPANERAEVLEHPRVARGSVPAKVAPRQEPTVIEKGVRKMCAVKWPTDPDRAGACYFEQISVYHSMQ